MIAIIVILLICTFLLGRIVVLLSQIEEKQNLFTLEQERKLDSIESSLTGCFAKLMEMEERKMGDVHDIKEDIQKIKEHLL